MKNFNTNFTKALFCLLISLFCFSNSAFSQTWQWAKSAGGTGPDNANKMCTDASGNVYVAGWFMSSSITLGTVTVVNSGISGTDVYVAKYDPSGNVIWAQRVGGASSEYVSGICTDAAGNVYVSGTSNSPVVASSPYTYTNQGAGTNDIYLVCFTSVGATSFLRGYGSPANENSGGVAFSNSVSAIYLLGSYSNTTLVVGTTTLTNTSTTGKLDAFLLRIASTGVFVWGRTTGSASCDDYAFAIDVDQSGNPCFTGTYSGTITAATTTIGGFALTSYGNQDMYVAKYNSSGTPVWSRGFGSTAPGDYSTTLDVDVFDNVFIGGYFQNASLVVGTFTVPLSGNYDAFVVKYNSSGTAQWGSKVAGGMMDEYCWGINTDQSGNVYATGQFSSPTITLGTGTLTNSSASFTQDLFLTKLNPAGTFQWATKGNSTDSESGNCVTSDQVGNVYTAGTYSVVAFGTTTLNTTGGSEVYVAKIGCLTTGVTGASSVCAGSSATLTANGATTYSWSTGATTPTIVITPTANTVYSVTGTSGSCVGTPTSINVTFLPASASGGSNLNLLCKQKSVIAATCNPASPTSVSWSPATNLSSTTVLNPTVTAGAPTTYTVNVTLSNGCVKSSTVNVSTYAQTPDICQVTVDSLSNYNEIYWDKTLYPQADSFIVYREVSTNTYKRIVGIPRTALSMYVDTNRATGPANGNPNLTYYKYKLQIKDSCGNSSPLSKWHETIFIQDQMNGNFNWNSYAIESATSTPVSIYNLKRRTIATGTETVVASTAGNLLTDPAYASFWPLNITWLVDAIGFNCNATAKTMVLKTKTKSNQSNDKLAMGISNISLANNIGIYPNPANDVLNVDLNGLAKTETVTEILNTLGQVVYQTSSLNQHLVINTSDLAGGVYIVNIKQNDKTVAIRKVVVEK